MVLNRPIRLNRRAQCVAALLIFAACSAGTALADDGVYVRSNGEHVRMIESPNEVAVFFREDVDDEQIGATKRSLSQKGVGELRPWPNTRNARVRIMTLSGAVAQKRSILDQNPEIVETRPIYYFEGFSDPVMSSGTLVFKLTRDVDEAELASLIEEYGLVDVEATEGLHRVYIASPDEDAVVAAIDLAAELAQDDRTAWAQPNLIRTLETRQAPGEEDTFVGEQWHLDAINARGAWVISRGQDVLLGMFDDSVDVDHEDMAQSYTGTGHDAALPSNSGDFNNPRPKKIGDLHGTAVMGLATAEANTIGVRGVAYLSRFTASRGLTDVVTDAQIASVYTFARQQNVDVHINSWGQPESPNSAIIVDAIKTAFEEGRDLDGDGGNAPLGMVIVFATGNAGDENVADNDYSSLPWVIGVAASNRLDQRTSYSNFGDFINVLAPGGDEFGLITTTDNDDAAGYPESGYSRLENPELDSGGRYTNSFSGTSAACPITAGVAAIILGANRNLTATDVRLIIEHTTEQIEPDTAEYDGLTSRSRTHGYGRIDALGAAEAALQSNDNGRRTWPERVARPRIEGDRILFDQNFGTIEFLVVESDAEFDFIPVDTACYDCAQTGCTTPGRTCTADDMVPLPAGVSILFAECIANEEEVCASGRTHRVTFTPSSGTKHFGIFARNAVGRYSFGVAIDSDGNVRDAGPEIFATGSVEPIIDPENPAVEPLSLVINATCSSTTGCLGALVGLSPMTVTFDGNATSEFPIDSTQTAWDFDISDAISVNTRQRNAQYTYEVLAGETKVFTARLTMVDTRNVAGIAEVNIEVRGGDEISDAEDGSVRILVELQGSSGSNVDRGTAPFDVVLRIDSANVSGTLQSVSWDLGDGSPSPTSLSVPHTYTNETSQPLVRVVTATITTISPSNTIETIRVSRLITVDPGIAEQTINANLNGTGVTDGNNGAACGLGVVLPLFAAGSLMLLRRRLW